MSVLAGAIEKSGRERAVLALRLLLDVGLALFTFSLGFRIAPVQIALAVVLGATLALHALGHRVLRPTAFDKPLLLYGLALGLGVVAQAASGASVLAPDALGVYRLAAGILLVGAIGDRERAIRLARIFVVAVALQGLYGVVQHYTGIDWVHWKKPIVHHAPFSDDRFLVVGTYSRHSTHAFVTTAGLTFLSAALLTRALGRRSWILALLAIPTGLGNLFTFVRTAWGALAAGLGTMAVVGRHFKQALRIFAVLAVLGGVVVAASPALREKASRAIDPDYTNNWHRGFMWARTLEMIVDHPVTGIGAGTFTPRTHDYYDPLVEYWPVRCHTHNNLLFVWAESGPLGLLAFVWLFGAVLAALRRGAKSLAPEDGEARAVILGAAGVVGVFLAWTVLQDPLYDGMIAYTVTFAMAVGLAAGGKAAAPMPFESVAAVEPPEAVPAEEQAPPARTSAAVAAAAFSCAALGGLTGLEAVTPAQAHVALVILAVLGLGLLPIVPAAPAAALRGTAIFAGAAVLASRPFTAVLDPGTAAWWASPSAAVTLAALVAGSAGTTWSIRRPGLVGPAPVAGALTVAWAAVWITLLEYVLFRWFNVEYNPGRPFSYNFAVGACAVGVLFVAWAGPLGFGEARVVGVAQRLIRLPAVVVAAGLLVIAAAGLGR
ncbi:O-antigen ligase family protein [Vulgatibacter sp.]|uniref:O-antigen ligase family protein n=1 Tax=Vulgatibacter sp. TaxID=1971226 RepID=UPI0035699006